MHELVWFQNRNVTYVTFLEDIQASTTKKQNKDGFI